MIKQIFFALFVALPLMGVAQQTAKGVKSTVVFDGYVYDSANGNAMPQGKILVYDDMLKVLLAEATADLSGFYSVRVPRVVRYSVVAEAPTYFDSDTVVAAPPAAQRIGFGLGRKPGYVFDITMFDKAYEHNPINTLRECKVEIYNNTTRKQELTITKLPKSTFNFAFAEGNHYTALVRKPGYLNRRIEVYVNVKGCILCVDGMGVKEPDVVPLMTHGNEIGFFLGAIDLDSIQIGKRFQLNNIYYDFNKWNIRPEAAKTLDKLAVFLKDNPGITVELGSHTDSRGKDLYNETLSDKRARAAVDYMVMTHGISPTSITAKGYGESQLANVCDDGVGCDEQAHQLNRRTEIKITGILDKDPLWDKSLKEIIEDVELYRKVIEQEKRVKATK